MLTKEEILQFLAEQKVMLKQEFQIIKLGLFGSYARNEQTDKSDIDLMIEFEPNTADLAEKKARIKFIVKSKFQKKVDICREKYIKPYYKQQILQSTIYV